MHHAEEQEQIALISWARLQEQKYPELKLLLHVPNGGKRSKAEAARLKAAGVRAGVPDLFLPIPKGDYHGLWIELKVKPNKPTQNQLLWLGALDAHGYACKVCYGFAEAAEAILSYIQGGTA